MSFVMKPSGQRKPKKLSFNFGLQGGINTRDHPERINADQAVRLVNYIPRGDGIIRLREGLESLLQIEEPGFTLVGTMLEPLGNEHLAFAYHNETDTKVGIYNIVNDTYEIKKTFSGSTDPVSGIEYNNDYFFCSNGSENIGFFHLEGKFINFDAQSANYVTGTTVTQAVSGATGYILSQIDNGATGTLLLVDITGTFVDNEIISGGGGSAAANGTTYEYFTIPAAPPAKIVTMMGFNNKNYLVAGNTGDNIAELIWSHGDDDLTTFPFQDWTITLDPEVQEAGHVLFLTGGKLNDIVEHKGRMYHFYDRATAVHHLEAINVDLVGLTQFTISDTQERNFGGYSAVATKYGVFYVNDEGLWRSSFSIGDQVDEDVSHIIEGDKIKGLDFKNSKMVYNGNDMIFIFCGSDSDVNNYGLIYYIKTNSFSELEGWNIGSACAVQGDIYGIDSRDMIVYKLFSGETDNGAKIDFLAEYRQEYGENPVMLKKSSDFWIQGRLSPSSEITISFNKWDKKNDLFEEHKQLSWFGKDSSTYRAGISKQGVSLPADEGDEVSGEDFAHKKLRINNYKKLQIVLSGSGEVGHEIHFLGMRYKDRKMSRINNLPDKVIVEDDTAVASGGSLVMDDQEAIIDN